MANRFSQPVQPFVVNPISIDTFSRVPLARAAAKAAGIKAHNSLGLDFNVDIKDQQAVEEKVQPIAAAKDEAIERIMSEGVSDDLISDFIGLRKNYKAVREDISQAEENKLRIEKWHQDVDKRHENDANYANLVRAKEYDDGWQGTFTQGEDGKQVRNVFRKQTGPASFSVADDFRSALKSITPDMIDDVKGGGRFDTRVNPQTGKPQLVFVNTQPGREYSNKPKLEALVNSLMQEYTDSDSQRGAYAQYRGLDVDNAKAIRDIANKVLEGSILTDKKGGTASTQVIAGKGDGDGDDTSLGGESAITGITSYTPKGATDIIVANAKAIPSAHRQSLLKHWAAKSQLGVAKAVSFWPTMSRYLEQGVYDQAGDGESYEGNPYDAETVAKTFQPYLNAYSEDLGYSLTAGDALGIDMSSMEPERQLSESMTASSSKYSTLWPTTDVLTQAEALDDYNEVNESRINSSSVKTTSTNPFTTSRAKTSAYASELAKSVVPGRQSAKVMMLSGDKKLVTEDSDPKMMHKVYTSLTRGGRATSGEDSYLITLAGSGTGDPNTYSSIDDNGDAYIPDDVAYGTVLNVTPVNKKGEEDGATFQLLVGPQVGITETQEYKERQSQIQDIHNLAPGEIQHVTYSAKLPDGSTAQVRGEMEAVDIATPAVNSHGDLVYAKRGQKVIYREGLDFPVIFEGSQLTDFFINKNQSGNYNLKAANSLLLQTIADQYVSERE